MKKFIFENLFFVLFFYCCCNISKHCFVVSTTVLTTTVTEEISSTPTTESVKKQLRCSSTQDPKGQCVINPNTDLFCKTITEKVSTAPLFRSNGAVVRRSPQTAKS